MIKTILLVGLIAWFTVVTIATWKRSGVGKHYQTRNDYRETDRRTPITTPEFIREELTDGKNKNVHQSAADDPTTDDATEKDTQRTGAVRRSGRSIPRAAEDPEERDQRA